MYMNVVCASSCHLKFHYLARHGFAVTFILNGNADFTSLLPELNESVKCLRKLSKTGCISLL